MDEVIDAAKKAQLHGFVMSLPEVPYTFPERTLKAEQAKD